MNIHDRIFNNGSFPLLLTMHVSPLDRHLEQDGIFLSAVKVQTNTSHSDYKNHETLTAAFVSGSAILASNRMNFLILQCCNFSSDRNGTTLFLNGELFTPTNLIGWSLGGHDIHNFFGWNLNSGFVFSQYRF